MKNAFKFLSSLNKKLFQNVFIKIIPDKSIFGFKILNSKESIFSAYFLLVFKYAVSPNFGFQKTELIGSYLFFIISNISLLILLINSLIRMPNKSIFLRILIIPLIIHIPISIIFILLSFIKLFEICF